MKIHKDGTISATTNDERIVANAYLEEVIKRVNTQDPAFGTVLRVTSELMHSLRAERQAENSRAQRIEQFENEVLRGA